MIVSHLDSPKHTIGVLGVSRMALAYAGCAQLQTAIDQLHRSERLDTPE